MGASILMIHGGPIALLKTIYQNLRLKFPKLPGSRFTYLEQTVKTEYLSSYKIEIGNRRKLSLKKNIILISSQK